MAELREETGVQRSLTERLVRSRLQWAGHVERMADDRLLKRVAELRQQGRRRRGRPRLRWEDCVKRDVRKTGEEEDWNKKKRDRGGWKRLSDEAVKKLRATRHPRQREKRKIYLYLYNTNSVCVCVCLSSIGGQTAGPIMTTFGTHMRIDLGMVPTKYWPHEWPGSVGSLGPISESGLSCQLLLRAVVWQMTSQ